MAWIGLLVFIIFYSYIKTTKLIGGGKSGSYKDLMDRCKLYLPAHEQVTNYVLLCDQVTYKMYLLTKLSDLIKLEYC
jgi:hypothetical protein